MTSRDKIANRYARRAIAEGFANDASETVNAGVIEVIVTLYALQDGRDDAAELGRIAREWYEDDDLLDPAPRPEPEFSDENEERDWDAMQQAAMYACLRAEM